MSFVIIYILNKVPFICYYLSHFLITVFLAGHFKRRPQKVKSSWGKFDFKLWEFHTMHMSLLTLRRLSSAQQTCAVCLEDFKVKDELGVLPCQHAFHRKWVLKSLPQCLLPTSQLPRLFKMRSWGFRRSQSWMNFIIRSHPLAACCVSEGRRRSQSPISAGKIYNLYKIKHLDC